MAQIDDVMRILKINHKASVCYRVPNTSFLVPYNYLVAEAQGLLMWALVIHDIPVQY